MSVGTIITLTVDRPAHGGYCVGRLDGKAVFVRFALPGETVRVKVTLEPLRRGWLRFHEVTVMCPDPLGLCRTRRDFPLPGAVLALPRRHAAGRGRCRFRRGRRRPSAPASPPR